MLRVGYSSVVLPRMSVQFLRDQASLPAEPCTGLLPELPGLPVQSIETPARTQRGSLHGEFLWSGAHGEEVQRWKESTGLFSLDGRK